MIQYKGKFVCLDLETTGLDHEKDDIIEIAAVKYNKGEKVGEFNTLINPQRPLPFIAHAITHISDSDLAPAPLFADVKDKLKDFLEDYPILGQNIGFDIQFLRSKGIPVKNTPYDTRILAAMILPKVPALNLEALALYFRFPYENAHRALADVYMTINVFDRLYQRLCMISPQVFESMVDIIKNKSWQFSDVFTRAAKKAASASGKDGKRDNPAQTTFELRASLPANSIKFSEPVIARTRELLEEKGAQLVDASPYRPAAWSLIKAAMDIRGASHNTRTLLAFPRATFAEIKEKMPALPQDMTTHIATLGLPEQYACPERVKLVAASIAQRARTSQSVIGASTNEMNFIVRIILWLSRTTTGDSDEVNNSYEEFELMRSISCNDSCVNGTCPSAALSEGCFWTRARARALAASAVVVNHRFLAHDVMQHDFAQIAATRIIIDDAHQLEDEISAAGTIKLNAHNILLLIDEAIRFLNEMTERAPQVESVTPALQLAHETKNAILLSFSVLAITAHDRAGDQETARMYAQQFLVDNTLQQNPRWQEVVVMMGELSEKLAQLANELVRVATSSGATSATDSEFITDTAMRLSADARAKSADCTQFNAFASSDAEFCTILTLERNDDVSVEQIPLQIAKKLQKSLYETYTSTLCLSSFASTIDMRRFIQSRLGLEQHPDIKRLHDIHAFEEKNPPRVLLIKDTPSPNSPQFTTQLGDFLVELMQAHKGKQLLLLSPSLSLIQTLYPSLYERAASLDVALLADGVTGSPGKIIEKARAQKGYLILGASRFWDRHMLEICQPDIVVLPKLPFIHPQNYVAAARQAQYQNGFQEFVMPTVATKLHHVVDAMDLLAAPESEKGAQSAQDQSIIFFDRRMTEGYAHALFDIFPQERAQILNLRDVLPQLAQK